MSKMSTEKKAKIVEGFKAGMTFVEAAKLVGISSKTIQRWCESDPEFRAHVDEARSKADDEVEAVTYNNCLNEDPAHNTLRMFWLKSRRPEVFREKVDQNHSGDVTIRVLYDDDPHPATAATALGAAGNLPDGEPL